MSMVNETKKNCMKLYKNFQMKNISAECAHPEFKYGTMVTTPKMPNFKFVQSMLFLTLAEHKTKKKRHFKH